MLLMIKPQFEVGREQLGKGGVVRDPLLHRQAVDQVVAGAADAGSAPAGRVPSRLLGPAGNQEYFAHLAAGRRPSRFGRRPRARLNVRSAPSRGPHGTTRRTHPTEWAMLTPVTTYGEC